MYRGECANQVTCNSRVNWRVHVYIFLGLNITSFRYERRGGGSRMRWRRRRRRRRKQWWVSVCMKPGDRVPPPLPPRAAEQSGFVSWKRASTARFLYHHTTTWPQFQLFRRYRQIEEAASVRKERRKKWRKGEERGKDLLDRRVVLRFSANEILTFSRPIINNNYVARERSD